MLPADLNRYCCQRRHDSYSSVLCLNVFYLDADDSVLFLFYTSINHINQFLDIYLLCSFIFHTITSHRWRRSEWAEGRREVRFPPQFWGCLWAGQILRACRKGFEFRGRHRGRWMTSPGYWPRGSWESTPKHLANKNQFKQTTFSDFVI